MFRGGGLAESQLTKMKREVLQSIELLPLAASLRRRRQQLQEMMSRNSRPCILSLTIPLSYLWLWEVWRCWSRCRDC